MWLDLLNKDPGKGNLNLRAYIASIVGPQRVAFGKRTVRRLPVNGSEEIVKNDARAEESVVVYVEVWVPHQILATGRRILFSSSDSMGENAELVVLGTFGDNKVLDRYRTVLLPKEQLYAQVISDATGNPVLNPTSIVISKVVF